VHPYTSESTPRSARTPLAFLAPLGARQLAGRTLRASGSNTGSLKYSRWGCGTRRALRGRTATALGFSALNPYLQNGAPRESRAQDQLAGGTQRRSGSIKRSHSFPGTTLFFLKINVLY
jgi:anti-sigma factor RsiW